MPDTYDFRSLISGRTTFRAEVAFRRTWNEAWTTEPHVYAEDVTWAVQPGTSAATLTYRYGYGKRQGETAFSQVSPLSKRRHYVRITVQGATGDRVWYGVVETTAERQDGPLREGEQRYAGGVQYLYCLGLEVLLDLHLVRQSYWLHLNTPAPNVEYEIDRGLTFNADGKPNRSLLRAPFGESFADSRDSRGHAVWWSTRHAVDYLVNRQAPRSASGSLLIDWDATDLDLLPDWDRPVLETHGRSLRALLNSLIRREQLLGWYIDVDDDSNRPRVNVFSFADTDVDFGEGRTIPAARRQCHLSLDDDAGAEGVTLKKSTLDRYEQVILQGRRRRSVCTLSFADSTLRSGWTSALETEYEAGASGAGDYPSAYDIELRQLRNLLARAAPRLASVYSRFALPYYPPWNLKAGDGIGGAQNFLFPQDADAAATHPIYPLELRLLPRLPLKPGYDYSTSAAAPTVVEDVGDEERPPLVAMRFPDTDALLNRYVLIEDVAIAARLEDDGDTTRRWSGHVRIHPDDPQAIHLRVNGEPQHVLAGDGFTPLPDAADDEVVPWNWKHMLVTVCLEDDRHCEGRWPATPFASALEAGADAARILVIPANAGPGRPDGYRQDYLLPGTVVGINPVTGAPQRNAAGGWLADDRAILTRLAKLYYQWHRRLRTALSFSSSFHEERLQLGDLVLKLGAEARPDDQQDIYSAVTEIRLTLGSASGDGRSQLSLPVTRMHVQTAYGELDALQFA